MKDGARCLCGTTVNFMYHNGKVHAYIVTEDDWGYPAYEYISVSMRDMTVTHYVRVVNSYGGDFAKYSTLTDTQRIVMQMKVTHKILFLNDEIVNAILEELCKN